MFKKIFVGGLILIVMLAVAASVYQNTLAVGGQAERTQVSTSQAISAVDQSGQTSDESAAVVASIPDTQDITVVEQASHTAILSASGDLSQEEAAALTYMVEEEKLARDVYHYLGDLWDQNTFANIEESESNHVNAVIGLLETYDLEYELAEAGTFQNPDLQELYDALIASGETDLGSALTVGARIEDLDIYDLEQFLGMTTNPLLLDVFASLQCGSRNHLRAFTSALETLGLTYEPEFISQESYQEILDGDRERCN